MEGLDVSKLPVDLLLNILNIVILFLITRFLVYKPVKKFMQERKERIDSEKAQAQQLKQEAESIKDEYSSLIADAEKAKNQAIIDGENEARQKAAAILEKANSDAQAIKKTAMDEADSEKKAALDNMKNDVASLAVSISEKILSREITDKDNERIVNSFLKDGDNV